MIETENRNEQLLQLIRHLIKTLDANGIARHELYDELLGSFTSH